MKYQNRSRCPHCDKCVTNNTHHDHFLTCIQTRESEKARIKSLSSALQKSHTPPPLRELILPHVSNYYDDGINNDNELEQCKIIMM